MHVLLVSSNSRVTHQVTTALIDDDQVAVTEVRVPERALALMDERADAGEEQFDVVLADNDTQPTGGFHLAREMKARERDGRHLPPVVLLMGRAQDDYLARWTEADAWLVKPIDAFDLAETLESLVERRPVPRLPGVSTFKEMGGVTGAGHVSELPPRPEGELEPGPRGTARR